MSKKRIVGMAIAIASLTSLEPTKVFGQNPAETTEAAPADDLLDLSLEELLNMKVTSGSFLDLDLKNSALSLTVINQEQIHLSGARHLSELLEIYVPGFQYMYNKWNGVIWGMRGVAADRNTKFIFLVNGHKMNTEARDGANMELDLGMLGDIERVEIIRGPSGLIYGSGAIGGVVNIVTERYKKDEVKASVTQGTWNGENFSRQYELSAASKINEHSNIVITGGYRQSDGIGMERGRLYGRPHWPYPQGYENPPANGVPTSGSAWSTPGNYRFGVDFNYKNFRYYSRYTHQVTNASGYFPVDVWPDYAVVDSLIAPDRMVDGHMQSAKGFYGQVDPGNTTRRQYVINNFTNQFSYELPVKNNSVILNAGFDMNTNRIQLEDTKSSVVANANSNSSDRHTFRVESFGERRYNASAMYLIKTVPKLQLAVGYQFRLFDIGKDMAGYNAQDEKANHPIVSNVMYTNHALFAEGIYKLTEKLNAQFGLRYDRHTRTAQFGGVVTPKIALVAKANENNIFKLMYQTSANNGNADNYEFNRNSIGDDGQPFAGNDYHYEKPFERPGDNSTPIPPVTINDLHKLRPERSNSIELTSMHSLLDNRLNVLPSLSYTTIKDLFAWSQTLFRVVNSGSYSFANAELDIRYNGSNVSIGINHVLSKLANTKVADGYENYDAIVFKGYDSTLVGTVYKYTPKPVKSNVDPTKDSVTTVRTNSIRDQITVDGKNFLNLASNITKIYIDYKPTNWLTLHTDARLFWGLTGRRDIHTYSIANQNNPILADYGGAYGHNNKYPYLGIHSNLMVKWNVSVNIQANEKLSFSVYAYDILAGARSINSLRWQQSGNSQEHTDLYGVDRTSFAVKLNYKFGL